MSERSAMFCVGKQIHPSWTVVNMKAANVFETLLSTAELGYNVMEDTEYFVSL
jgi:hypothetical protein